MNVVTKTLACAGLAAVAVAGVSLPAQATASPVSAAAFASQAPAPAAVQSITQFKWPTLKAGEAGEMKLRIKPARGVALPTAAGVDLQIEAPNGAIFNNAKVVLEDPTSLKKETLTGTLSADHTKLTVTSKSAQASSAYGIRAIFNLYAVNPTDGDQWGTFRITGGGAFAPTTASYSYKGIASEVPAPIERPVEINYPSEGEVAWSLSPSFGGTGTAGATVTLTRMADQEIILGTAVVDNSGEWHFQDRKVTLDSGRHLVKATQTHGDEITSDAVTFIQDLTPVSLTSSPAGTVGPLPTFSGKGIQGHILTVVLRNKATLETFSLQATVDENNNWSVTATIPLPDGVYAGRVLDPLLGSAEHNNNMMVPSFTVKADVN